MKGYDTFCVAGTGKGKGLTYMQSPLLHDCIKYGRSIKLDQLELMVIVIYNKIYTLLNTVLASEKIHKLSTTFVNLPLIPNKSHSPSDPDPMSLVVNLASNN